MRHIPAEPMRSMVESLWWFRGELRHQRERILPVGRSQLLVNLAEDALRTYDSDGAQLAVELPGSAVSGAHAVPFAIDTQEQRAIVGATFAPGGAYPFFGEPACALTDQHVALDALWGHDAAFLRERMLEAETPKQALLSLEEMLWTHMCKWVPSRGVTFALTALERGLSVRGVCDQLGWPSRRLLKAFRERVGLTPKRYGRVRRLQRTLTQLSASHTGQTPPDMAQLAVLCGYYDQAHMIREFRVLAGSTPSAYRARSDGAANHIVLSD